MGERREIEFVYLVIGSPKPEGSDLGGSDYVEQAYMSEVNAEEEARDLNGGPSGKDYHFRVSKFVIEDRGGALDPPVSRFLRATRGGSVHAR